MVVPALDKRLSLMKRRHVVKLGFVLWFTIILVTAWSVWANTCLSPKLLSAGAILLSASLALSAAVIGLYYQRQTAKEKNTLEFQQKLKEDKLYNKYLTDVSSIINADDKTEQLLTLADQKYVNDPRAIAIRYVLNTWEQAANAIRHNLYDENFLYSSHKSCVIKLSIELRKFIRERQKANILLYSSFNWLSIKWSLKRNSFEFKKTKKDLRTVFKLLNEVMPKRSKLTLIKSLFSIWFIFISLLGGLIIYNIEEKLASTGAILLSATLALSAAILGMYYQRKTAREKNTLDFMQDLKENEEYPENLKVISSLIHTKDNDKVIGSLANSKNLNSPESVSIRHILNIWEQTASAINHRLYDEDYLYLSHKSLVIMLNLYLSSYIEGRQKINGSFYSDFVWLSKRWGSKRKSYELQKAKRKLQLVFKKLDQVKPGKISADWM
ncbi:hypothetical protein CWC31_02585 [Pseudoalteromonas ruthenica]|uniref:DUF4760 domain-containing protein n=1 Tax=Pseudoalteromonas ruthenica TaxID=151081 RepID=UPI00110891EA|nr:DUF4760 domain-containing protein [Pseudoalteromonas ruthenica]TLX52055.1 hypothetical protein CWC31_02585 [Pseudoalteromonas ruthenica]